jgi:glutamate-ammonia-ligase adenylyltransferase
MKFAAGVDLEPQLASHTQNVSRIYSRVFNRAAADPRVERISGSPITNKRAPDKEGPIDHIRNVSPHIAAIIDAHPGAFRDLTVSAVDFKEADYRGEFLKAVLGETGLKKRLAVLRRTWSGFLLDIAIRDIFSKIDLAEVKRLQTCLAEASIEAALVVTRQELAGTLGSNDESFKMAVLALGKLGGRALDYSSDLDLLIVYDDAVPCPVEKLTHAELYSRAVEIFVNALSSVTRDGHLYRVDLRLRPYGSKGLSAISRTALLDYMRENAAIWEMLAFVKLRAVGGDREMGSDVESKTRETIHGRALAADGQELKKETRRVRLALEKQKGRLRRKNDIDIKYGPGGLLDVYFAIRYLQLRDDIRDADDQRSTSSTLERLYDNNSIGIDDYQSLSEGYEFLSTLDHNLRLTAGRTTRLPAGDSKTLTVIATRMEYEAPSGLLQQLTVHRLSIRDAFDKILGA